MKIAVVQMNLVARDVQQNIAHADALITANPGADLYVLPEMFSTGSDMEPDLVAEPLGGPSLQWMQRKAAEMGAAICGSVATAVELFTFTNRLYFVTPDGKVTSYDKRHLFTYGGEAEHYTAGHDRVVATWKGVRFLLEVCYDLRFPVWSRYRGDYDAIIYVANWPVKRRSSWDVLLQARAAENQCYVVAANRVGTDQLGCDYDGGSVIVHPYGHVLVCARDREESVMITDIDMDKLCDYRSKFPALVDADEFILKDATSNDN